MLCSRHRLDCATLRTLARCQNPRSRSPPPSAAEEDNSSILGDPLKHMHPKNPRKGSLYWPGSSDQKASAIDFLDERRRQCRIANEHDAADAELGKFMDQV